MNRPHDCGGVAGYGPVVPEVGEPVFHDRWEARMFALMSAAGDVGGWTLDEDRSACESMEPALYPAASYYERWLAGLETLLVQHGLATTGEIDSGRMAAAGRPVARTRPDQVPALVTAPGSYRRPAATPARFRSGAKVRTITAVPATHTRLPNYLRGHTGVIVAVHGAHVFPDSNAIRRGEDPRWLYTVQFGARDLFGGCGGDLVHADLWEPYLEPA